MWKMLCLKMEKNQYFFICPLKICTISTVFLCYFHDISQHIYTIKFCISYIWKCRRYNDISFLFFMKKVVHPVIYLETSISEIYRRCMYRDFSIIRYNLTKSYIEGTFDLFVTFFLFDLEIFFYLLGLKPKRYRESLIEWRLGDEVGASFFFLWLNEDYILMSQIHI